MIGADSKEKILGFDPVESRGLKMERKVRRIVDSSNYNTRTVILYSSGL
jgi:hypothetical protein